MAQSLEEALMFRGAALARRPAPLALVFASLQIGSPARWSLGGSCAFGCVRRSFGGASDPHVERARDAQRLAHLDRRQDGARCHFGGGGTSGIVVDLQASIIPHRLKRNRLLLHIARRAPAAEMGDNSLVR